ncbi:MAG: hypothetical protein EB092_09545, partial [Chitinophagia bacterium]|nr:hypothetical protein [Chitinophagia bacterium]
MKNFIMKYNKYLGMGVFLLILVGGFYLLRPGQNARAIVMQYPFVLKSMKLVNLSTYKAAISETDSTPLVTASGFKLDSLNPKKHRVIAISRDLKELFSFGDKVKLSNAGKFNGIWFIHDLMNKKYRNKIDIL